jgi:hypothetical protein
MIRRLFAGGSRIRNLGPAEDARPPRGCRFMFAPTIFSLAGNQQTRHEAILRPWSCHAGPRDPMGQAARK